MTRQELIEHLIAVAHSEVANHNCRFEPAAELQLRELVTSGVDTMIRTNQNTINGVDRASNNMRLLCKKLCDRAIRTNRIVENREFSNARWTICPIWPFC